MVEEERKVKNRYERLGLNMALSEKSIEDLNDICDDRKKERERVEDEINKAYKRYEKMLSEIDEKINEIMSSKKGNVLDNSIAVSFRELLLVLLCLGLHYLSVLYFVEKVINNLVVYKYMSFILSPSFIIVFGLLLSRYLRPSNILQHNLWVIYVLLCMLLGIMLPLNSSVLSVGLLLLTMIYPTIFVAYAQRMSGVGDKILSISVLKYSKDMIVKEMYQSILNLNVEFNDLLKEKERFIRDVRYGYCYGKSISEKKGGKRAK